MDLYLMRHGVAVDQGSGGFSDLNRPLSQEGRQRLKAQSLKCKTILKDVRHSLSSPLRRALETSKIIAETLYLDDGIRITDTLAPLAAPADFLEHVFCNQWNGGLLATSHQPFIGRCVEYLTGIPADKIEVKKGSVIRLDVYSRTRGSGTLRWIIPPRVMIAV